MDQIADKPNSKVKLVTIFFGSNDCSLLTTNPRQHVPVAEYSENIKHIIQTVRRKCVTTKIILITPPPICEVKLGNGTRTNEEAGKYASAGRKLAQEMGIPCLDLWTGMQEAAPDAWEDFLNDGLHLSASGGMFVGKELIKVIEREFPDIAVIPCQQSGNPANSGSRSELPHDAPWQNTIIDMESIGAQFLLTPPLHMK